MATQRFYDGQPGPDIRRELNNFEAKVDGTVAAAQDASTAATSASVKAQQWANAAPGVEVETGKYSAKHWADRAQTTVTGGLIYRGSHSAASGAYPATPSLGDYYKISAAGTLGGVAYSVGDSIIYNGTGWDKIDSTDAVTSVAGRVGVVVLTKGDVGLGNVDNTSDANKPVSTATQTALNTKVDKVAGKQLSTEDYTTAEKTKLAGVAVGAQVNTVTSVAGKTGAVTLAKTDVGLTNVDNTSDANKPVSTATQNALNSKEASITAGTTSQYWRGDKTWRDFFTDVRAATLTGLSTATNAVVAATDTVLAAIGKLQAQVSAKFDKTGGDIDGNINITGAGRRITGDFSNAPNRPLFQTSVANGNTTIGAIPNGSGSASGFVAYAKSDITNSELLTAYVTATSTVVAATKTGSGNLTPLLFSVGDLERLRIDPTTGNVLVTSGALGYGVGAGGTVIQGSANGKNTPVALNKLCGAITMDSQTLAPGATATFNFSNSTIGPNSMLFVQTEWGVGSDQYSVRASVSPFGGASISLKNETTSNQTDAVSLRFFVFNGVVS